MILETVQVGYITSLKSGYSYEKALYGFDIEAGGNLKQVKLLSCFISFYHFNSKGVKPIHGIRCRSNFKINRHLSLDGEISRDRLRGIAWYAGLKLALKLGKKKPELSVLEQKMTQAAVRDIDIITKVKKEKGGYKQFGLKEGLYEFLNLDSSASDEEVVKAHKELTLYYHPDHAERRVLDEDRATETTQRLNDVRDVILEWREVAQTQDKEKIEAFLKQHEAKKNDKIYTRHINGELLEERKKQRVNKNKSTIAYQKVRQDCYKKEPDITKNVQGCIYTEDVFNSSIVPRPYAAL